MKIAFLFKFGECMCVCFMKKKKKVWNPGLAKLLISRGVLSQLINTPAERRGVNHLSGFCRSELVEVQVADTGPPGDGEKAGPREMRHAQGWGLRPGQ